MYIYMKTEFLKNWTGGTNSFGQCEKFKEAEGSSLSNDERAVVNDGGVALHKKGGRDTKVFVMGDNNDMWSVTVKNSHLPELKQRLKEVGYLLPPAA